MDSVRRLLEQLGGYASTKQLRSAGVSERMLTNAVRDGTVARVRNGIYSSRSQHEPAFRALAIGGRLTGLSALAPLGCWIWQMPRRLQVAVPAHATRLRMPTTQSVDLHWERQDAESGGSLTSVSLRQALVRAALDEPLESAVACIDWALHTGRLDRIDFEELILSLPPSARVIRYWVDRKSQSVLESVARVRLLSKGWKVRSQARLGDLEAIDLVIEDIVALELDGREFHADSFDEDRHRDLRITVEGRHAIRVSMSIARADWPLVERAIETALALRRHGDAGNSEL